MKFYHDKEIAVSITVNLPDDLNEYCRAFVAIFNNVREYQELYKIDSYYGSNDVTVTCAADEVENTKKFLSQFGKIVREEKVLYINTEVEWEYDELPDDCGDVVTTSTDI